jgi:ABC-type polysaccharide/polyol phosphate transport system ATPase subunit
VSAADTAVAVEHVSKTFIVPHERRHRLKEYVVQPFRDRGVDRNEALRDVSLTIGAGEFFGIVGHNGSGKSTLLKIIAGIYRADAGRVRLEGAVSPFIELGVGFNPELSARDNIAINGTLIGLSPKQLTERFDDIVAFAEVERFVDQHLKNYSSGMLLRLAFAIAVQVPFDILLVDEVLAVGDAAFQAKCVATLERHRSEGKTIIFVSHDLHAISHYCDRALLLERGRSIVIGDPAEVVETYRSRAHAGVGGG